MATTQQGLYIRRAIETRKIQLLSLATPNGQKIAAALEELGLPYEPHTIDINKNEQFAPEFLEVSPNNKIPAIVDPEVPVVIRYKHAPHSKSVQIIGAHNHWKPENLHPTENGWEKTVYLVQGTHAFRFIVDGETQTDPDQPTQTGNDGNTNNVITVTEEPIRIFESGAILLHLAEKTGKLIPQNWREQKDTIEWLFWQVGGVGPMLGQYGHFVKFAKENIPYAIERYENEAKRLLGVLEKQLHHKQYVASNEYTIADIAIWPWIRSFDATSKGDIVKGYPKVGEWLKKILERPASQKALTVTPFN